MATPDPFTRGLLQTPVVDKNGLLTWPWLKYFQQRLTPAAGVGPDDSALLASEGGMGGELQSVRDMAQLALLQDQGVIIHPDATAELAVLLGDPPVREVVDSDARLMLALLMDERAPVEQEEDSDGLAEYFSENETPGGAIDGSNRIYELDFIPSPKEQLELLHNGLLQRLGTHFRLIESTVIMAVAPISTDNLRAFYPYRALKRVGNEEPAGVKDGANVTFTLERAPSPATSLELYHNGDMLIYGTHYTLAGLTITTAFAPISTDHLMAFYRVEPVSFSFVENETPGGLINGVNVTFTLANNPNPDASLKFKHQGILEIQGVHYTLSGVTVTMGAAPLTGENLAAAYRY